MTFRSLFFARFPRLLLLGLPPATPPPPALSRPLPDVEVLYVLGLPSQLQNSSARKTALLNPVESSPPRLPSRAGPRQRGTPALRASSQQDSKSSVFRCGGVSQLPLSITPSLHHWLSASPSRRLIFLVPDLSHLAFHLEAQSPWLLDPQIEIEWLPPPRERESLLQALSERHPTPSVEVLAPPALRLALLRKTFLSHALFLDRIQGHHPLQNFLAHLPHLPLAFDANALASRFSGVPAIICGAGPSLSAAIPWLEKLEGRALVIAGGSAIAALSHHGYAPHLGVAIDPNPEEGARFERSLSFETPLLFSLRLHPSVLDHCNGPFGYWRAGVGGAPELWLEEELRLTTPLSTHAFADESISVTAIALDVAKQLGCTTILLAGMDLAYTDGRRYSPGVSEALPRAEVEGIDRLLWRKDKRGKRVETALRWILERKGLSHFAEQHPDIRWINTTPGGLSIEGFEEMTLEAAAAHCLTQQWDLRGRVWREIATHPLGDPATMRQKIEALINELETSLHRVREHLEVLTHQRPGSTALAELELKEELAYSILFYDLEKVARQALQRSAPSDPDSAKWTLFAEMAAQHEGAFAHV